MTYQSGQSSGGAIAAIAGAAVLAGFSFLIAWIPVGVYATAALLFGWRRPPLAALGVLWATVFVICLAIVVGRAIWTHISPAAMQVAAEDEGRGER